jgi:NAD(P)H-dependent flavin oxidoreductase YrpB (nitropropane dioxygenase family)
MEISLKKEDHQLSKSLSPLRIGNLTARIPVIQGGMGVGISLSRLAGNVAKHGGVGVISAAQIGFREPDFEKNTKEANFRALHREVAKARKIASGNGLIGMNIMVAMNHYAEYVKESVKAGVDLIISGAGMPVDLPEFTKGSDVKLAPIVSSEKAAAVILKMWDRKYKRVPDLLIAEGPKAGGHLGFSTDYLSDPSNTDATFTEEVRKIVETAKRFAEKYGREIPVVAAGGIYTRQDADPFLEAGALGVQMGTRFVTTEECDADVRYKEAYIQAKKSDIQIVKSPVGMPGRAIRNTFIRKVEEQKEKIQKCYGCMARCNPAEIPYCITQALSRAANGNTEDALLFCGANAWKADRIETVPQILAEFS